MRPSLHEPGRREFLIVEIGLLHDNRVPVRGSINIRRSTMAYWAVD